MFKGRNLDQSIILLCVRWYLAYGLAAIGPAPICFFNARLSSVTAYGGIRWIGSAFLFGNSYACPVAQSMIAVPFEQITKVA